jgi:hypothetical protein
LNVSCKLRRATAKWFPEITIQRELFASHYKEKSEDLINWCELSFQNLFTGAIKFEIPEPPREPKLKGYMGFIFTYDYIYNWTEVLVSRYPESTYVDTVYLPVGEIMVRTVGWHGEFGYKTWKAGITVGASYYFGIKKDGMRIEHLYWSPYYSHKLNSFWIRGEIYLKEIGLYNELEFGASEVVIKIIEPNSFSMAFGIEVFDLSDFLGFYDPVKPAVIQRGFFVSLSFPIWWKWRE